jgi:aspartate/methionine/tyrosine aminotransferase
MNPKTLAARLPVFTWDRIAPLREKAGLHPNGPVDLSMGTPVDPVPDVIRGALAAASDAPGYPATRGTAELRAASAGWLARTHGVWVSPDDVLPVVGTKEFIAWLPVMLGLGPGDVMVHPALAYPTYDIGARLAGATAVASDWPLAGSPVAGSPVAGWPVAGSPVAGWPVAGSPVAGWPVAGSPVAGSPVAGWPVAGSPVAAPDRESGRIRLVWLNSPSNPTGRVLSAAEMRATVDWARAHGAVVASDECYITLGWETAPVSVLRPDVCGPSRQGVLAVHSLSKRSNLAGYRAGFVTGDPALIADLLAIRKQAGMIMPGPVQAAMTAALEDESHATEQRERYGRRRSVLRDAFVSAGWRVDHSEAGLYLWVTHPAHDCWSGAELLADQGGILVAPGELYGSAGARHVRVALTATDERIAAAAQRLNELRSG